MNKAAKSKIVQQDVAQDDDVHDAESMLLQDGAGKSNKV